MKYILKPYHRNVPSKALLKDLKKVSKNLRAPTLTRSDYRSQARFHPQTLARRFGSWNAALNAAGLSPSRNFRVPATTVLADLKKIAAALNTRNLTLAQYQSEGQYSATLIYAHFKTWASALAHAGLAPSPYHPRITDQTLLQNLENLWKILNRQPRCVDLVLPLSPFGVAPYQRRFGTYHKALEAFIQWKKSNLPPNPPTRKQKSQKKSINHRLRYQILHRDHFKCQSCGQSPATHPDIRLQIDHIHPRSRGGLTTAQNLRTLCQRCNLGKSDVL